MVFLLTVDIIAGSSLFIDRSGGHTLERVRAGQLQFMGQINLRNPSCPYYKECLTKAAILDQGLDCSGCPFVNQKIQLTEKDFWACCLLFAKIYRPEIYKSYIKDCSEEQYGSETQNQG